jgi:uncharacterized membrane protein
MPRPPIEHGTRARPGVRRRIFNLPVPRRRSSALTPDILCNVREEGAVTLPTLSGVLSIYLLVGMFFSFLYAAIQAADDDGFFAQVSDPERSDFLYFSYITLSTTGYGDLTPAADLGRTVAVTEALFGQIYLVTIVALIVANLRPRH